MVVNRIAVLTYIGCIVSWLFRCMFPFFGSGSTFSWCVEPHFDETKGVFMATFKVSQTVTVTASVEADNERDAISKAFAVGGFDFICAYENSSVTEELDVRAEEA